jgi:hypothetical protein
MRTCLLALALVAVAAPSHASPPDPANSEIDQCLIACPAGNIVFFVLIRDFNRVPINNASVVIDFCDCPGVTLCPASTTDPYDRIGACQIRKFTGTDGKAVFAIRAGGVCSSLGVRIYSDGLLMATRRVASPDQDGDLVVEPADLDIASTKNGSADPTADLDCDGLVTDADLVLLTEHAGHRCPPVDPTAATRRTWGGLKTIYR